MKILKVILYIIILLVVIFGYISLQKDINKIEKNININTATINDKISFDIGILKYESGAVREFKNNNSIDRETVKYKIIQPRNTTEQYYKNLNELLKVSNPTKVELLNIKLIKWLGDDEKFFTIIFKNKTTLPAHAFNVEIWDNNKTINFKHSKVSNIFYNKPTIAGNKVFEFPLVSKSELAKYLGITNNKILGIGITPNIPIKIMNKAKVMQSKNSSYSEVYTESLGLQYGYNTIFDDKIKVPSKKVWVTNHLNLPEFTINYRKVEFSS